jgi:actin-related protein 6
MRRLNIGGKLLTNYLKELVSYRQWNMMDEYLLMNQVRLYE